MFKEIKWRAYYKVNSKDKALKILKRFEGAIGSKIELTSCEPYWKDQSLYEVNFVSELGNTDIKDAIFNALIHSQRIGHECHVTGPQSYEGEKWSFEGIIPKTSIAGVEWVIFSISNL
jgi:hypothetical protein